MTEQRLQALEEAVLHLREEAAGNGCIVEGRRDVVALEALGVGGRHVLIHRGHTLEQRIDRIAELAQQGSWRHVLLLTDWDRTGGRLARRLQDGLAGRLRVDLDCRRRLAAACQCRCLEDVPAELAYLRARFGPRTRP